MGEFQILLLLLLLILPSIQIPDGQGFQRGFLQEPHQWLNESLAVVVGGGGGATGMGSTRIYREPCQGRRCHEILQQTVQPVSGNAPYRQFFQDCLGCFGGTVAAATPVGPFHNDGIQPNASRRPLLLHSRIAQGPGKLFKLQTQHPKMNEEVSILKIL